MLAHLPFPLNVIVGVTLFIVAATLMVLSIALNVGQSTVCYDCFRNRISCDQHTFCDSTRDDNAGFRRDATPSPTTPAITTGTCLSDELWFYSIVAVAAGLLSIILWYLRLRSIPEENQGKYLRPNIMGCCIATLYTLLGIIFAISCSASDHSTIIAAQTTILILNMLMVLRFVVLILVFGIAGHFDYFNKTGAEADAVVEDMDQDLGYVQFGATKHGSGSMMRNILDEGVDTRNVVKPWIGIVVVSSFWMTFTAAVLFVTLPIRDKVYN